MGESAFADGGQVPLFEKEGPGEIFELKIPLFQRGQDFFAYIKG
jgi:hypothetical protein